MSSNAVSKFEWEPGDMRPGWLSLAGRFQQEALLRALRLAPLSRQRDAFHMLSAPPWPSSEADAAERCAAVIRFLLSNDLNGYRPTDRNPGHPGEDT